MIWLIKSKKKNILSYWIKVETPSSKDTRKTPNMRNISFRTEYSHYEFVVMPFGITNALTYFMCVINNILSKYLDKFKILFIYDILISSTSERDHEEHLKIVLKTLQENHLYDKFSKCDFYKHRIQYLVHVI